MECEICGGKTYLWLARDMQNNGPTIYYRYYECLSCGCVRLDSKPPADLYKDDYYSFQRPSKFKRFISKQWNSYGLGNFSPIGALVSCILSQPPFAAQAIAKTDFTKEAFILDVGCGTGSLLYNLKDLGYTNLYGIDPFVSPPFETGVTIVKTANIKCFGFKYNLIMFNHSFEHVPNSLELLKDAAEMLDYGGKIIIRIPCTDCEGWTEFKEKWFHLDAPRHHVIHSVKSLRIIADAANLEILEAYRETSSSGYVASVAYVNGIKTCDPNFPLKGYLRTIKNTFFQKNKDSCYCFILKPKP